MGWDGIANIWAVDAVKKSGTGDWCATPGEDWEHRQPSGMRLGEVVRGVEAPTESADIASRCKERVHQGGLTHHEILHDERAIADDADALPLDHLSSRLHRLLDDSNGTYRD